MSREKAKIGEKEKIEFDNILTSFGRVGCTLLQLGNQYVF